MLRSAFLIFIFLGLSLSVAHAQQRQQQQQRQTGRHHLAGSVVDNSDGQAMPMVQVGVEAISLWTVTDMEGKYELRNIPPGRHLLMVRCLGYNTLEKEISIPTDSRLDIRLTPTSLALGEVVVTAQRGSSISTSSVIGRSAIEHLQASDITEIMQLLPGQIARNPNLMNVSQFGIREITGGSGPSNPSTMGSLGTAIMIDGAPISNVANMQSLSTATGTGAFQSTAGQGVDMRQFPVDNIESVEVVQGIPGVEEGDVLSGVVRISTIRGRTPLTTRVKVDPNIKQASVGKGFYLPASWGGTMNLDVEFLQTHSDIRTPTESFNRLTGGLAYNNTFFKDWRPIAFNFSTRFFDSRTLLENDPDRLRQERRANHDQSLSATLSARWALNSLLLTNLNLNVSGRLQQQETEEYTFRSFSGVQVLATSSEPGEHQGIFLNPRYYSDVFIEGRPRYLNATLNGTRTFQTGPAQHTIRAGIDYRYSHNKGRGSMFDRLQPPDPTSSAGVRPRPFYDIPSVTRLAFYVAEELSLEMGGTTLDVHAGVRFNNLQPDGLFTSSEELTSLDPRLNVRYRIFRNRGGLVSDLGLRFGYGLLTLMPTMRHLYPDMMYRDLLSFNYYDSTTGHALVVHTVFRMDDTRNYDLQAAQSNKLEAGLDIRIGGINVMLTAYQEHQSGGFTNHRMYYPVIYNRYDRLERPGVFPQFIPGTGVVYQDPDTGQQVAVPSRPDTLLRSHAYPTNGMEMTKYGLEFELDFGRVEALHTTFLLGGAYMYQHQRDTEDHFWTSTSVADQVVGIFHAGGSGRVHQRIISNLRTVTHIRPLAMVVSLNLQALWMERSNNSHEHADGTPIIYTLEPTDDVYGDISQRKYYHPHSVMDLAGNIIPWQPEFHDVRPYADLVRSYNNNYHFVPMTRRPAFQLNMRLTKELSRAASISFIVNNVAYYQPLQQIRGREDSYTRRNSETYFSGELTIRL